MLTAYFDESGTDRSKTNALVVAGYISTDDLWDDFQHEWENLKQDEGVGCFHMTDLECFHGEFTTERGWHKKRQKKVIQRAHSIIKEHVLWDLDASLQWSDYDELIANYRAPERPSAYAVLVNSILIRTGDWAKESGYSEPIKYIFESGPKNEGEVRKCYERACDDPEAVDRFLFGGLHFEDKRNVVQLQAADFNAYESWKQLQNRILKPRPVETRPIRKSAMNLKGRRNGVFEGIYSNHIDREGLEYFLKQIEEADFRFNNKKLLRTRVS